MRKEFYRFQSYLLYIYIRETTCSTAPPLDEETCERRRWPTNMRILWIVFYDILETNFFCNLPNSLKILQVKSSTGLHGDSFRHLPLSINTIRIIDCGITSSMVSTWPLSSLKSLKSLFLQYNDLTEVPGNISASLELLDLASNRISTVLPLDHLVNLWRLALSRNLLVKVPGELPPNLRYLELGYNGILYLPQDAFVGLASLEQLELNDNK